MLIHYKHSNVTSNLWRSDSDSVIFEHGFDERIKKRLKLGRSNGFKVDVHRWFS